ncbi:MAG: MerR family DNA-binding protein [Gammaproteobacteria bacterium]|nr:MerR family DNA-binding protein [Gammaproteobacteria bacterium]
MYVTELSNQAAVSPDTVRYYSKIGMLKPTRNADNGYQVYGHKDVRRLRFIRAAKSLGYTLADIRAMFADADHGDSPCPRVRAVIEKRIHETEVHLAELTALHAKMKHALEAWRVLPDSAPSGDSVCALIESLQDEP